MERDRSVQGERPKHPGAERFGERDAAGDARLLIVPQPEQAAAARAPGVRGVLLGAAA